MQKEIDFSSCDRILDKAYNGANGSKISIMYNGARYMLKFPPSGTAKPTELSYINSCISEHIGSSIFNLVGIAAQKTLLGTFSISSKTKIVCACLDFTDRNKAFYDFASVKNTVIDSEHNGTGTELVDIEDTIERQHFVQPQQLSEHFWNMFVVDALIGNFDRHNGNWGFIYDMAVEKACIAPVFDCGSSLLPRADDKTLESILSNKDEMNARIFNYPLSAIKMNNKKINYFDFLSKCPVQECANALLRIVPNVDLTAIRGFINDVPYISQLQKEFYCEYIGQRYSKLLLPAYTQAQEMYLEDPER